MRVLIAGIAGASLGTEIAKALRLAGGYQVFGADISPLAYGHYDENFEATEVVGRDDYIGQLLAICQKQAIDVVVAGADQTAGLISADADRFAQGGISVCQNTPEVVRVCSDKALCFERLKQIGVRIPETRSISNAEDLENFPMPCVIKPAKDSGGSAYVFFARDRAEAKLYARYLLNNGKQPIAQAYLDHIAGEFTVGVLSLSDGRVAGSVALKRSFANKLSIAAAGSDFLISSGYSQGEIRDFPAIRAAAEKIASALGSVGPLNIQGRLAGDGSFVPFEINPRFSATTFLRALAGFHEVDVFLRHLSGQQELPALSAKPGWYLRTLAETRVDNLVDRQ